MKKIVSSTAITMSIAFGVSTPSQGFVNYGWEPCDENTSISLSRTVSGVALTYSAPVLYRSNVAYKIVRTKTPYKSMKQPSADKQPSSNFSYPSHFDNNTESYSPIVSNNFKNTKDDPLSTLSIDVDTASYANVRRYLNRTCLPPKNAVRIEELVNYFSYDYPQPDNSDPFSVTTELSIAPWNKDHQLLHVGIQGKKLDFSKAPSSNLVFLVDTSGSMYPDIHLVKKSLKLLVDNLRPTDRVSIVTYAGNAGLVLPSTSGNNKDKITDAIDKMQSGGSTAGGAGIKLAYKIAKQNFIHGGNNRIILATDGDFNVGVSSEQELEDLIKSKRNDNVFLSVLGFGQGNYQDAEMEVLADKGNGNYAYIDNLLEAKKVLVKEMGGTLYTIAKDVKIQIEFNPEKVKSYRLIGYENRLLKKEDFNNDKVDAGELGAGHTVTALYEIIPTGASGVDSNVDDLKYQTTTSNHAAMSSNELANVKLRYKEPTGNTSQLIVRSVIDNEVAFIRSSNNFRFSSAVASFGMLLRDSKFKGDISYKNVINIAKDAKGKDLEGYRSEFVQLVEKAEMADKNRKNMRVTESTEFRGLDDDGWYKY